MSQRAALEEVVIERATHDSLEDVGITCSFARAERLLGREYHGRFLIELLQNAADAWRADARSAVGGGRVHVAVTDEPCLLVANDGVPITADAVISSLGHIGASTKPQGEAIGHKGIGFKSVLEICDAPELYSGLRSADPLAVGFRPDVAIDTIRAASPRWDEHLASTDNVDPDDPKTWVPVLRYPTWIDDLPADVTAMAADGYDTVVRLPLVAPAGGVVADTTEDVRRSIEEISDEILLLLAGFREVTFADRTRGTASVVRPENLGGNGAGDHVRVLRDGDVSSAWRLHRSRLDGTDGDLASELTVGLRVDHGEVMGVTEEAGGAPFHLFFPTRIPSGTPLLLHGYFEVDASRTGFYGGSQERNHAILQGLAALAASAIEDVLDQEPSLGVSLATALAEPLEPADPLARDFRRRLLRLLDDVEWVPTAGDPGPQLAAPSQILALPALGAVVHQVFPEAYVAARALRHLPHPDLPIEVLELVRSRQGDDAPEELDAVEELLLPGDLDVWDETDAGTRFHALLDLVDAMHSLDRDATDDLLSRLRSNPASRIVPTVSSDGIELHPCADPSTGRAGEASRVIMARVRQTSGTPLAPPAVFDIDFLPDALLASEADVDRAKPLGVRQFTVDSILDRLGAINHDGDPGAVLAFLCRLLDRERASSFGIQQSTDTARIFDPAKHFWCQPRRNLDRDTGAPRQRRERNLTQVRVPCRDGTWRPAGEVAFGGDWADWIEANEVGAQSDRDDRAASLRALERLAPDHRGLLAAPAHLLNRLAPSAPDERPTGVGDDEDTTPVSPELRVFAFLLRLGVWQVLPVEAWDDLTQSRDRRPWPGRTDELREAAVQADGGWVFSTRPGRPHHNVWIGDDFRFLWPLGSLARRDPQRLSEALNLGLPLYRRLLLASVFCPWCSDDRGRHGARHRSGADDRFPSQLAIELRHHEWVPITRDGDLLPVPVAPVSCWWGQEPIGASVLRQSPERFLDRTDPTLGVTRALAHAADMHTLSNAHTDRLAGLLQGLRTQHQDGDLGPELASSGLARQAFVGLHRRIYLRLAQLHIEDPAEIRVVLEATGVLCERGSQLVYSAPSDARHDDGTHASHLRYFADDVARVVLPRDASEAARHLGIPKLSLSFDRRGSDPGNDVTSQLAEMLHDRVPELLAILVHHSQGTQTLEPTSGAFERRARRLQRLTVRQLDQLALEVRVDGTDLRQVVGLDVNEDSFLEGATTVAPVLYHDLTGPDWVDRLRRHLAPHVAVLAENMAYEHTFEAFFNREGPTEREHFLLSLGIRPEDVDRIADRVGVVSDDALRRRRRWFAAVADVLGHSVEPSEVDLDAVEILLEEAGLDAGVIATLVEFGGERVARRDATPDGAMAALLSAGVDLDALDEALRAMHDEGLEPGVAAARFRGWRDANRWPLIAVLAPRRGLDEARATVQEVKPSGRLRLALDPSWPELLEPVVAALERHGLEVDVDRLVDDPMGELARAADLGSVAELQQAVATYSDTEAWQSELRDRASRWRRILIDLAILAALPADGTRARVRQLDEVVKKRLPFGLGRPSELRSHLDGLFPQRESLVQDLSEELVDDVVGPKPSFDRVALMAARHNVPVDRHDELAAARRTSRGHVDTLRKRGATLQQANLRPKVPAGLATVAAPDPPAISKPGGDDESGTPVRRIKVDPAADRKKRKTGDEGEQWALAATLHDLAGLDSHGRRHAIDELSRFLERHFTGEVVAELAEHGDRARTAADTDDEEFLDAASRFLHVSATSDAFGFDVLGWQAGADGSDPVPVCLEVKSTGGDSFHLSTGEWNRAENFRDKGLGTQYAVLAVVRNPSGGAPVRMDLLPDPVSLFEQDKLARTVDGYKLTYQVE